jgi:hypothetical protein
MDWQEIQNHSKEIGLIFPLIKICKIHRLTTKESIEYCHKNNWKCSRSSFFEWKNRYEQDIGNRFIEIARYEWVDENLLVIDKYKEIERQYWKLFNECDNPMDAKHILDSLRALQETYS